MQPVVEALLQSAHDPTWIVGADQTLVAFNGAFARLYQDVHGQQLEIGIAVGDLFPDPWSDLLRRALAGRTVSTDLPLAVRGFIRAFSITGTPVAEGRAVTNAVFAARALPEAAPDDREHLFELSLTRLFLDEDRPLTETLEAAVAYLCESDEWDCGVIWLLNQDVVETLAPNAIYARTSLHDGHEFAEHLRDVRFSRGRGLPGRVLASDEILWIGDIADETNVSRAHLAVRLGLHGAVAVPLRDGPRVVGVLELFTRSIRPLNDARASALLRTGAGLGRLIERRRADEERRRLIQVIERKGLEWTLTFDAIELPIFITSMEGVVRRMNRAARDLAGGDYTDTLGRGVYSFGATEPWTTLSACVEAVRDSGETCTAQAYDPQSDRSWDISANSYRPADDVSRVILIVRETTSVIRLQNAVRRGEQLSALGELVAGVAHEVRNPLFGMQITLDALESILPRDPEPDELFAVMRRWIDRLNRLMESLLTYGRTWTIDLQQGSLAPVVDQAVQEAQPVAERAHVEIRTTIETTQPMLMDSTRLVQAIENLLTNAVQHTDENGVVELTARDVDGMLECSVRDHGAGFAPQDLPRIFEPFFTRRRGGTGLGLAIVQRIVDEHGGTIHASNAENGGARITVRFPVYQPGSV